MSETQFVYPEVHIGDDIEFAIKEDMPDPSWSLGQVERLKNQSVDVKLSNGRRLTDVRHVGDPILLKRQTMSDSGVFRLCHKERMAIQIRGEHEALKQRLAAQDRKIASLEQTFRAVMESQAPAEVPAARRQGRPATAGV